MVRLKDIAGRAQVSLMTVSKALRDAPDISAATKAKIQALAKGMGYVPNSAAQGLRTRNTRLFGLIVSAITNPIYARVVMAIEERAHLYGYEVILSHTLNRPEREEVAIRRLLARRVEGLFISPVYRLAPSAPIYEELLRRRTPTVLLGHTAPFCYGFVNVETDDLLASYSITRHLLQLGHRQIAFLTGPSFAPWSNERLDGYRRALREFNIEIDDNLVFTAGTRIEDGEKAALEVINEGRAITAVQAVNDSVAIGAAEIFLSQGYSIPGDISVAGFGNILMAEHFRVALTTVRQPKYRLGTAAIETMAKLLRGERAPPMRLPAELTVRASTGPVPGHAVGPPAIAPT